MVKNQMVLSRIIAALSLIYLLAQFAYAWSDLSMVQFFRRLSAHDFLPDQDPLVIADGLDRARLFITVTSVAAFLAIVISFCIWTFVASRNARYLSSFKQKIGPGWAVGWYFIPFANLWMPFQSMREIWWRSAWPPAKRAPELLRVWWISWIGVSALSNIVGRLFRSDDTNVLSTASAFDAVLSVLWVLPVSLFIWVVLRLTSMQNARFAANPDGPANMPDDAPLPNPSASAV